MQGMWKDKLEAIKAKKSAFDGKESKDEEDDELEVDEDLA